MLDKNRKKYYRVAETAIRIHMDKLKNMFLTHDKFLSALNTFLISPRYIENYNDERVTIFNTVAENYINMDVPCNFSRSISRETFNRVLDIAADNIINYKIKHHLDVEYMLAKNIARIKSRQDAQRELLRFYISCQYHPRVKHLMPYFINGDSLQLQYHERIHVDVINLLITDAAKKYL